MSYTGLHTSVTFVISDQFKTVLHHDDILPLCSLLNKDATYQYLILRRNNKRMIQLPVRRVLG